MDSFTEFMLRFSAALVAGALVGLERERARVRASRKELPGLRSFGLLSVYGALTGYAFEALWEEPLLPLTLTLGFLVIVASYTAYRLFVARSGGVTTSVVMLLVYTLGFLAGLGYVAEAVAASAVTTLLLALKTPIARIVKAVSYEELLAIFELALFYLALAPLVYSLNVSVLGVNLSTIYTFFLLVLTVSFTGYIAWRVGAKPEAYAFFGGVVNSEATVALLSERASAMELRALLPYVYSGMQIRSVVLAAAATMLSRPTLFQETAALLAPPLLASIALTVLLAAGVSRAKLRPVRVVTPLDFGLALKTVAVYTGLLLAAAALKPLLVKPEAVLAYALLGGLVSATATIFAISAYTPGDPRLLAAAYLATIAASTLNKVVYARAGGSTALRVVTLLSLLYAAPYIIAYTLVSILA